MVVCFFLCYKVGLTQRSLGSFGLKISRKSKRTNYPVILTVLGSGTWGKCTCHILSDVVEDGVSIRPCVKEPESNRKCDLTIDHHEKHQIYQQEATTTTTTTTTTTMKHQNEQIINERQKREERPVQDHEAAACSQRTGALGNCSNSCGKRRLGQKELLVF